MSVRLGGERVREGRTNGTRSCGERRGGGLAGEGRTNGTRSVGGVAKKKRPFVCVAWLFFLAISLVAWGTDSDNKAVETSDKEGEDADNKAAAEKFDRPRSSIYMGLLAHTCFRFNSAALGSYWKDSIRAAYQEDLYNRYKEELQVKSGSMVLGVPQNYFDVLLLQAPSELLDNSINFAKTSVLLGAFIFRKEKMLVALELCCGKSFYDNGKTNALCLFKGDVPTQISSIPYDQKAKYVSTPDAYHNIFASYVLQGIFFGGNISLKQNLQIKEKTHVGGAIHCGCVVGERMFVFAILGAEGNRITLTAKDIAINADKIVVYLNRNQWPEDSYGQWLPVEVGAAFDLCERLADFNQTKYCIGAVLGAGANFFVSHNLFLRFQTTFAYHPEMKFYATNNKNAEIRYSHRDLQCGLGLCVRFT